MSSRMANHVSSINTKNGDSIPQHFTSEHTSNDFSWMGLEKVKNQDIRHRKIHERFGVRKLRTLKPKVINENGGIGDQDRGVL